MRTCHACGATNHLHEGPYYDPILKRDSTDYFCDDLEGCLDKSLPEYYKRSEENGKSI